MGAFYIHGWCSALEGHSAIGFRSGFACSTYSGIVLLPSKYRTLTTDIILTKYLLTPELANIGQVCLLNNHIRHFGLVFNAFERHMLFCRLSAFNSFLLYVSLMMTRLTALDSY